MDSLQRSIRFNTNSKVSTVMIPLKNLGKLLNDTVATSDTNTSDMEHLTNEVSPLSTNYEDEDSLRSAKLFQDTNLAKFFGGVDAAVVAKVGLFTLAVLLLYDLLVYYLAPMSRRKSLMMTPWLVQVLSASWDDVNQRSAHAR